MHSQIISKSRALDAYNALVADAYSVLDQAILEQTDAALVTQAQAFVRMGRAEDLMLQESALISGDLAARSFPAADRQQFTQLVGARRALYAQTLPDLQPSYRGLLHPRHQPAGVRGPDRAGKPADERHPGRPARPPVQPQAWEAAVGGVAAGLSKAATQASNQITAQAATRLQRAPTWSSSWRAGWACSR